ncbi:hypothetical protein [Glycomyces sp. NPDC048151]|uniref:hypothetical protein n=1 Tax=Glycomyces sp. NPDC048151 TaxID=3364002 RepID=UPI00371D7D1F
MTVEYLSRHLKNDVGIEDLGPVFAAEAETIRPIELTLAGSVGRLRMRSLWKEAGYTGRHRRRGRL